MARIIFKLKEGGLKTVATLPDGSERYFEDLMTHRAEIVKDTKRLEAFLAFFAVLEDYIGNDLPPKTEVLDIFGRVVTNTFNIMNDDYQNIGRYFLHFYQFSVIPKSSDSFTNFVTTNLRFFKAKMNVDIYINRLSFVKNLQIHSYRKFHILTSVYFIFKQIEYIVQRMQ